MCGMTIEETDPAARSDERTLKVISACASFTGTGLVAGDRVFGLAHGCLGTIVSGPTCMVAKMPPDMSMQVRGVKITK